MSKSLWMLTQAVALSATLSVGSAMAQTVIVRNAPPGATLEAQLNTAPAVSATVDAQGLGRVSLELPAGTPEATVRVYVDACSARVQVVLMLPSLQPDPPAPGCTRTEIAGVFVVRPVTTFVINAGGSAASLRLRQGPAPQAWLVGDEAAAALTSAPPTGLMLFGGAGLVRFADVVDTLCGGVTCVGGSLDLGWEAGAAFWPTSFLGAQASVVKPRELTVSGSGGNFSFEGQFDSRLLLLAANVGGRAGRVRLYGQGGANYLQATVLQTQTTDDTTVTVDGQSQTIPGGTQTLAFEARGWGWLVGGGLEVWVNQRMAIYADGRYADLRGRDPNGGEAAVEGRAIFALAGLRVRVF